MNFFRKSHNKEKNPTLETPHTDNGSTPTNEPAAADDRQEAVPETPPQEMPDKNSQAFMQMVRQEAKSMRLKEQILTPPHLARVEDAIRLNETKMENLEDNLERTRKQQERVHRYQELTMELREQKAHLYEINKQKASSIREREELERYEEFENVQGQFQRLSLLDKLRREQKLHLSELSRQVETLGKEQDEEQKRLQQEKEEREDAGRRLTIGMEAISEALQIEGRSDYLSIQEHLYNERCQTLTAQQTALEKEIQEHTHHIDELNDKIQRLTTRRQSLVPHHRMALHDELVQERLTRLAELEVELAQAEQLQKESQRKETDENELLERVYSSYQQVEQDIEALKDELHVHRENNHGLDSYRLQERAMKLKLRRAMLIGAQSLWVRIAEGYSRIEDVTKAINSLRLKHDMLQGNIDKLDKELGALRRTCKEKEYTFTLSKSQNVIQLRSDLKEGTSCTVCGATHHPYHSDTMLEQNKLIGEFKMEYEAMASELKAKEQQLHNMELEHAAVAAQKEETENTLIMLRELQNGYTRDWQPYSHLDRTFEACDSSVNATARTAMLRQLVENIGTEVDDAQKELDTFNFHQKRINELSEQIARLEHNRTDLITRLNEVNTGCQVMAGQLESAQNRKQKVNDAYTRLFDQLDNMITIPDWTSIWKRSHEALQMRIQEITKEWKDLEEKLTATEHELQHTQMRSAFTHDTLLTVQARIAQSQDDKRNCNERREEDADKLEKLIGKTTSSQRLRQYVDEVEKCQARLDRQQEVAHTSALRLEEARGRLAEHTLTSLQTDERTAEEQQGLDLWMRQYNANHPPVQYAELEAVFGTDKDWNAMRTHLRNIEMDALLTQSRTDKLASMLIALQAEGSLNDNDTDLIQHQLASQIDTYENRRRETMLQIATLTLQLQAHKKAEEAIRQERMEEDRKVK